MCSKFSLLFCFAVNVGIVLSSEILFISYAPQWSHQSVLRVIYRDLSLKGHKVTALTIFPFNDTSLTNLTEIDWSHSHHIVKEVLQVDRKLQQEKMSVEVLKYAINALRNITEENFRSPFMRQLVADKTRKFEAVIVENYGSPYYAFAEKFNCPLILVSSMPGTTYVYNVMGMPDHPVLYPDPNIGLVGKLTFYQRVFSVIYNIWYDHLIRPELEKVNIENRGRFGEGVSTLDKLNERTALFISTSIPGFHTPRAVVPNFVTVNGLHIVPEKVLPMVSFFVRFSFGFFFCCGLFTIN